MICFPFRFFLWLSSPPFFPLHPSDFLAAWVKGLPPLLLCSYSVLPAAFFIFSYPTACSYLLPQPPFEPMTPFICPSVFPPYLCHKRFLCDCRNGVGQGTGPWICKSSEGMHRIESVQFLESICIKTISIWEKGLVVTEDKGDICNVWKAQRKVSSVREQESLDVWEPCVHLLALTRFSVRLWNFDGVHLNEFN